VPAAVAVPALDRACGIGDAQMSLALAVAMATVLITDALEELNGVRDSCTCPAFITLAIPAAPVELAMPTTLLASRLQHIVVLHEVVCPRTAGDEQR